jgi:hypothetical protein
VVMLGTGSSSLSRTRRVRRELYHSGP